PRWSGPRSRPGRPVRPMRAVMTDAPPRRTRRMHDRPRRAPAAPRARRRATPRPRVLIRLGSHSSVSRGCSATRDLDTGRDRDGMDEGPGHPARPLALRLSGSLHRVERVDVARAVEPVALAARARGGVAGTGLEH